MKNELEEIRARLTSLEKEMDAIKQKRLDAIWTGILELWYFADNIIKGLENEKAIKIWIEGHIPICERLKGLLGKN